MTTPAPWLVFAVGNPSRGDDALGPSLVERLRSAGVARSGDVELRVDYQLQIEHALDLDGRRGVLFVDAARRGVPFVDAAARRGVPFVDAARRGVGGVSLARIAARKGHSAFSHALQAPALLEVAERVVGRAPPAWQLAIEGECFALGEGLSPAGRRRLDDAVATAWAWLRERGASLPDQPNCLVSMYSDEISDHQSSARPLST